MSDIHFTPDPDDPDDEESWCTCGGCECGYCVHECACEEEIWDDD